MLKALFFTMMVWMPVAGVWAECQPNPAYQIAIMNQKYYEAIQDLNVTDRLAIIEALKKEALTSTCADIHGEAIQILSFPLKSKLESVAGAAIDAVYMIAALSDDSSVKVKAIEELKVSLKAPVLPIRAQALQAMQAIASKSDSAKVLMTAVNVFEEAKNSVFIDVRKSVRKDD